MSEVSKPAGSLVIIGGALRYNNHEVWKRIVELSGGEGAKIAVFPTASRNPQKTNYTVDALRGQGAEAIAIPVAVKNRDINYREAVYDPQLLAQVRECNGVFFTGGDQSYITQALYTESGENTPMLDVIWEIYRQGGVVAGTSAGAAIMSTTMFRHPPKILDVMKFGVHWGQEINRGLGFIGPDYFVDQHFLVRGRLGRSLVIMQAIGYKLGFGIDENTALIVQNDEAEVVGDQGVLVMDLADAHQDLKLPEFNLDGIRLSYLGKGDRYDLQTQEVTLSELKLKGDKIDPNDPDFRPYMSGDRFYPDLLAHSVLDDLLAHLIDSNQQEVIALAFNPLSSDRKARLGFKFTFWKGQDSLGYYTGALGVTSYTVLNIYAAVKPIQMKPVLYDELKSP